MTAPIRWLASTIGKRNYIAKYLRESSPPGSVIIGTGNETFTPGFAACDRAYRLPAINDAAYLDAVLTVCLRERITAMITLSDLDLEAISKIHGPITDAGIACFFPKQEIAMRFLNKQLTFDFCLQNGIKTPRTTGTLEQALNEFGFPLVIKPIDGSASQGIGIFHDRMAVKSHWRNLRHPIAQEYIQGRQINVESCSSAQGDLLVLTVWERYKSVMGETLLAETIDNPAALKVAAALLRRSPIPGPTDMDFIERDGELFLIEVNTRFGGGYPVSHLAGADFTGAMVRSLEGQRPHRLDGYRRGVVMMKEICPFAFDTSVVQEI